MASGALFAVFYGLTLVGDGFGDDLWIIGLSMHAVLIVLTVVGLVAARAQLRLDGWASWMWNASIAFAFLGLTIGHPPWSLALFGLAVVAFTKLGRIFVAASLAVGGLGWLYLFWSGVRVGDEGGPTPSDGQVVIGVAAITLMALGLIGLGISLRRVSVATTAG